MFTMINDMLSAWAGFLIVLISGILVTLAALVWIVFFRKNKRRRHRRRHSHPQDRQPNPTLAQIGGLPPAKQNGRSASVSPTPTLTSQP